MKQLTTRWPLLAIFLIIGITSAQAAILPAPQQISKHVFAWIGPLPGPAKENNGYRMNLVFVVGNDAVAVIDTGYTAAMAREMIDHINTVTDKPIRYAINSSSQPHRFMGNDVFANIGAKTIAHKDAVTRMAERGGDFASAIERILELKPGAIQVPKKPMLIIEDKHTIDLGGVKLILEPYGATHTTSETIVSIPSDNIVYTGDVLYSQRLLAILRESDIKNWLSSFEKLKGFGDALFIPGHGKPDKLSAFEFPTYSYLTLLYTHMNKAIEDFVGLQDAIDSLDQSAYKDLANFDILAGRNASWTYVTLEAQGM